MGFFIGGVGSSSSVDWSNVLNKPALDPEGITTTLVFSDTSPKLVGVAIQNTVVGEIILDITQAFNDLGTVITIGDSGDHSRLMSTADNDPNTIAKYTKSADYKYSVDTNIYIYFSGTNAQGSATARVYFE